MCNNAFCGAVWLGGCGEDSSLALSSQGNQRQSSGARKTKTGAILLCGKGILLFCLKNKKERRIKEKQNKWKCLIFLRYDFSGASQKAISGWSNFKVLFNLMTCSSSVIYCASTISLNPTLVWQACMCVCVFRKPGFTNGASVAEQGGFLTFFSR